MNISDLHELCKEVYKPTVTREDINTCFVLAREYDPLKKMFDTLIDNKSDIRCSDFADRDEARQFYEYIGGMNNQSALRILDNSDDPNSYFTLRTILVEHKETYDPYNLDSDNNGIPCESS